jgi:hypothetical protein
MIAHVFSAKDHQSVSERAEFDLRPFSYFPAERLFSVAQAHSK